MKKYIMLLLLSYSYISAGQSSGKGIITLLNINKNGTFVRVKFSQPIVNPNNCQKKEFYIVELEDNQGANRFYSALLAAYTAQKKVSFYISGCSSKAYWGSTRPRIFDIYLYEK